MFRKRTIRVVLSAMAVLFMLGAGTTTLAIESRAGDTVIIAADEVIDDDLYAFGANVIVDGTIIGDLIFSGSTLELNGVVEGDLLGAGQVIQINGLVGDDVRMSGAILQLGEGGEVRDDLLATGYSLETKTGSVVGGDLLFVGGQAVVSGSVAGDVTVNAASAAILGDVGGDVEADVGGSGDAPPFSPFMFMPNVPDTPVMPGGLIVGDNATVGGTLRYSSPDESALPSGINGDYTAVQQEETGPTIVDRILDAIRLYISLLIVGLLLILLLPRYTTPIAAALKANPLGSLGRGSLGLLIMLVAFPVATFTVVLLAIIFSLLTLGNLTFLTVILGVTFLFLLSVSLILLFVWMGKIIASMWLGELILGRSELGRNRFLPYALGLLIVVILVSIPYVGGLFNLAAVLLALGAEWLWIRGRQTTTAQPENDDQPLLVSQN